MTETTPKISTRLSTSIIIVFGFVSIGAALAALWLGNSSQPPPERSQLTVQQLHQQFLTVVKEYQTAQSVNRAPPLEKLRQIALKRRSGMVDLLRTDTKKFLDLATSRNDRSRLPVDIQLFIEVEKDVQGTLTIFHEDNFEKNVSRDQFILKNSDGSADLTVYFADRPTNNLANASVKLHGWTLQNELAVAGDAVQVTSPAVIDSATGTKKVAVILLAFQNDPAFVTSVPLAQGLVFGSVRSYYTETSFSNLNLTGKNNTGGTIGNGDVYTTSLDINRGVICDSSTWGDLADVQLGATTLGGYDYFVYMFKPGSGCPQGATYIGYNKSYVTQVDTLTIGHELGHGFGAHHANSYSCTNGAGTPVPISGTCTTREYRDMFDIMGNMGTRQMNNFHKGQVGFLQPNETQDITQTGTYTLWPVEVATTDPENPKVKTLRIPRTYFNGVPSEFYYLEYRQPVPNFDNFNPTEPVVNGISIRLAPDYSLAWQSKLLDTTPATNFFDSALQANQTFTDPDHGITLTLQTLPGDKSYATVAVSIACNRNKPNGLLSVSPEWIFPGQTTTLTVDFYNNDGPSCPPSDFTIQSQSLPSGWSQSPNPATVSAVPPLSMRTQSITVTAPPIMIDGQTNVNQLINHTAVPGLTGTLYGEVYIDTAPPIVTIANPLNQAELPATGTVQVLSTSTDANYMQGMEIFIDGVSVKQCYLASSCDYDWSMAGLARGYHTVLVTATDASSRVGSRSLNLCYPFTSTGQKIGCSSGGGGGPLKIPE